jgi:hypothetical protein
MMNSAKGNKSKKEVTTVTTVKRTANQAPPQKNTVGRRKRGRRVRANNGLSPYAKRYLTSLLFPETIKSKVPDVCSISTSMVQVTYDGSIATNSSGIGGVKVTLAAHANGIGIALEDGAATSDTAYAYLSPGTLPAVASFNSAFSASRLVSASLQVEFVGTTLNDQGSIFLQSAVASAGFAESLAASNVAILSARDNARNSLRDGAYMRWKPLDDTADDFHSSSTNISVGSFIVHVSGAVASSTIMRLRLILNYEAIPSADTFTFQTVEPSPSDPSAYIYVRDLITRVPSITTWWDAEEYVGSSSLGSKLATASILSTIAGVFTTGLRANRQNQYRFGAGRVDLNAVD